MAQWFIRRENRLSGPISGHQLRELALAGKLNSDDLVRKGGDGDFIIAEKVKNLFSSDQVASRPSSPPPKLPSKRKIDELETAGRVQVFTPRRLLVGVAFATVMVLFIGLLSIPPSDGPSATIESNSDVVAEANENRNDHFGSGFEATSKSSISSNSADFFQNLPANIDSSDFQGRKISVTGLWTNRGKARDLDGGSIKGKISIGLSTEYKDVSAVCHFDQTEEDTLKNVTSSHSQLTVSGTFIGRHPFPDKDAYIIMLDNCSVVDKRERGQETIEAFSRRLPLPKADTFMAQFEQMGGSIKKQYTDPRTIQHGTKVNFGIDDGVTRKYYDIDFGCSYQDWVDGFGEPTLVRDAPGDRGHVWVQSYNGETIHVLGVLKTGLHFTPMIKTNELVPGSYPPSSWNVIVWGACVE
ncbi:DUF4339 domain-containing protein [Bremerella sp. P1]|uniref:DUF4339 domain-containing protein n=1 Tax=Bremerella sp. P1 TaxID=3026424 RepID=UPI0023681BDF|nr:DUF4339 domain-containing protein [Bremerella sp. P1]WDI39878.1 DUF4339 domain-containing protein [Bremerella sp. P1]